MNNLLLFLQVRGQSASHIHAILFITGDFCASQGSFGCLPNNFPNVIFELICLEIYKRNLKGKEGETLKIFITH
jgi:hypothetical protein